MPANPALPPGLRHGGPVGAGGTTGNLGAMPHLRLAAAQLNTVVGDLSGNVERILGALAAAEAAGRRHLRGARARHPRVPARGPPPQARVRGRQRDRAREGRRRRHGAVRGRGRVRRRRPGRRGPGQRGGGLRRRPGRGRVPQALPPQLRRLRRAALVHPRATSRPPSSASPGPGSACPSARTSGSTTGPWPSRPRRGGRRREPQRLALQPWPAGRAPRDAAGPGGRGRVRHRLRQPGGRAGRAGLRRRLPHRGGGRGAGRLWRAVRRPTWWSSTSPSGRTGPTPSPSCCPGSW